jgi:hypothetical protein
VELHAPCVSDTHYLDALLTRPDALADGFSDGELARMVRRRDLLRLQRGAYLPAETGTVPSAAERYRVIIAATIRGLRIPGVVGHASAAVLHGLPLWRVPLGRVHVIRRPPAGGSGSNRVHLHVTRLPVHEVTVADDVEVTTVTRTIVDLARTAPFESAVIAADAALAARGTTPQQLLDCLDAMGPGPGTRRATRVVEFADGRSGSVGESRSRVVLHELGLAPSGLQFEITTATGAFVARTDFVWEEEGVVGEFDGRIKYGRLSRPGQEAGDAVFEEKRREDAIRDLDWEVARWTWGDLAVPSQIGARVERARTRGARRRT